ncbi:MAG: hypothetical protein RPS47_11720 [Colwellia sp.]|jgi:hypothetical protein
MTSLTYQTTETAMLILEKITHISLSDDGDDGYFAKYRQDFGIQHERDIIICHAAPALNKAAAEGGDLNNSCFDIEIVSSAIEFIQRYEEGLEADQATWNAAYNYAHAIHEGLMSEADALKHFG